MLREIPRAPRRIDARTLHERLSGHGFETTLRTVQRDLKMLSTVFPITSDEPARPTGWWWADREVHDLPSMDPSTALTFVLAERFLAPLLPPASLRYLEPHFVRARSVLGGLHRSGLGRWASKVRMLARGLTLSPPVVGEDVVETVYEALLEGKRFTCMYVSRGETSAREYSVSPLGLVFRDGVIYLVATLWHYEDIVQLALHRMRSTERSAEAVTPPEGFDMDRYIDDGKLDFPTSPDTIPLRAAFTSDAALHLAESSIGQDQELSERPDGRTLLAVTVPDTAQLRWWLLGFGDQVEVLEPAKLREELAETAARTAALYR